MRYEITLSDGGLKIVCEEQLVITGTPVLPPPVELPEKRTYKKRGRPRKTFATLGHNTDVKLHGKFTEYECTACHKEFKSNLGEDEARCPRCNEGFPEPK